MVKFILIATLPLLAACQLKQSTEPRSDPPTQAQAEKIIAATAKSYESSDIGEIMARAYAIQTGIKAVYGIDVDTAYQLTIKLYEVRSELQDVGEA